MAKPTPKAIAAYAKKRGIQPKSVKQKLSRGGIRYDKKTDSLIEANPSNAKPSKTNKEPRKTCRASNTLAELKQAVIELAAAIKDKNEKDDLYHEINEWKHKCAMLNGERNELSRKCNKGEAHEHRLIKENEELISFIKEHIKNTPKNASSACDEYEDLRRTVKEQEDTINRLMEETADKADKALKANEDFAFLKNLKTLVSPANALRVFQNEGYKTSLAEIIAYCENRNKLTMKQKDDGEKYPLLHIAALFEYALECPKNNLNAV